MHDLTYSDFARVPLHDALLDRICVEWRSRLCTFHLRAFVEAGAHAQPYQLTFSDLSEIHIPMRYPWGESVHINGQGAQPPVYSVEMQSGDEIMIVAESFSFKPAPDDRNSP